MASSEKYTYDEGNEEGNEKMEIDDDIEIDEEDEEVVYSDDCSTSSESESEEEEDEKKLDPRLEELMRLKVDKVDNERSISMYNHLSALRQNIDSLSEERERDAISVNDGIAISDPLHTIHAMENNLWVLATAAALQLNDVGDRCENLMNKYGDDDPSNEHVEPKVVIPVKPVKGKAKKEKVVKTTVSRAKAKATPSKVKEKERKDEPVKEIELRERNTRDKDTSNKGSSSRTRNSNAEKEKKDSSSVNDTVETIPMDEPTVTTRKRKHAQEEKEEKKEKEKKTTKASSGKRTSGRVAKKVKEDEPTYCICARISFGDMIGCDNEKCTIEWFHFECVNLRVKPKGKWFCPDCRIDSGNSKLPKPSAKSEKSK